MNECPPYTTAGIFMSLSAGSRYDGCGRTETGTRICAGARFAGRGRKEKKVYYTGTMVQVLVMVMMPMIRALMIPAI